VSYKVKEIFYTLQGEGANTGRAAVFCRFSGCNLWTGRETDRYKAICQFCDTDFTGTYGTGGGHFATSAELAQKVFDTWQPKSNKLVRPLVVCTGGEPLLQLDDELVEQLHKFGFEVAVETNGTKLAPKEIDWICVSPKAGADLILQTGDELKLVFPQIGISPEKYQHLDFKHFFLQPMDSPDQEKNILFAVEYCKTNPRWRLSLQTHKILGIP
jgi:7-carboxy-7-deazaguanine synthase (Cx14CxxC type)